MIPNAYADLTAFEDFSLFRFTSIGPRGRINKAIMFMRTDRPELITLAFGDVTPDGEMASDRTVTNNGDREKVLATLANAIHIYTEKYPDRWIVFEGSTPARNRLYHIAIRLNFSMIKQHYEVYSLLGDRTFPFGTVRNVTGFLIKRKNVIL